MDLASLKVIEDIVSLVVLRIFAKRKKGQISHDDFATLASLGAAEAVGIITVKQDSKQFEDMVIEEIRMAVELIALSHCGQCRGRGVVTRQGARFVVCRCVNMVHYKGDTLLPLGEQYSNEYFTGEFSKNELGRRDTVINIANAVGMFLRP